MVPQGKARIRCQISLQLYHFLKILIHIRKFTLMRRPFRLKKELQIERNQSAEIFISKAPTDKPFILVPLVNIAEIPRVFVKLST